MKKIFYFVLSFFILVSCSFAAFEKNVNGKAKVPFITLNNGIKMPQFGLGTYHLAESESNNEAYEAVLFALKNGYRHIDTAHAYQNEKSIARAIKNSKIPRKEIWITSKLWPTEYSDAENAIDKMLKRLGIKYIDLIYLHQPVGEYMEAWEALVKAQKKGKVKAIGISNFDLKEELYNNFMSKVKVKPQIMQLECHPYAQRVYWQEKLKKDDIKIECWFPLGGRESNGKILNDSVINEIAKRKGKSPAQIIIRWHIQKGFSVIPGASNPDYIKENIEVFDWDLLDEEMKMIENINKEERVFNMPFELQEKNFLNWKLEY